MWRRYTNQLSLPLPLQAVSDVQRGWIPVSDEQSAHLDALSKRGSKKEVNTQNHV